MNSHDHVFTFWIARTTDDAATAQAHAAFFAGRRCAARAIAGWSQSDATAYLISHRFPGSPFGAGFFDAIEDLANSGVHPADGDDHADEDDETTEQQQRAGWREIGGA